MFIRTMFQAFVLVAATPVLTLAQTAPGTSGPAWSPYVVGGLIGVLSMFTFYFSNKPIGASTAYARLAGLVGQLVARQPLSTRRRNRRFGKHMAMIPCRICGRPPSPRGSTGAQHLGK
jgi:hypothetical protein